MSGIQVSVVIASYRRPHLLDRCLNALTRQNFDPDRFEVIVVDNAGCKETEDLVEEYARISNIYQYLAGEITGLQPSTEAVGYSGRDKGGYAVALLSAVSCPRVKYLRAEGKKGPAAARNTGWRAARGEIIAFTDDDCIPDPDWLIEGVTSFDGFTAGVSGWVEVQTPAIPTDYERNVSLLTGCAFVTANCFYRRTALEEVGGFDERFPAASLEDTDLYFTMLSRSYQLKIAPSAIVNHPVQRATWGISLKQQQKGMYNALLYKKHPQLYQQYVQRSLPLRYYLITLSATIGVVMGVMQQWPLAILFWGLWATQTLYFAIKRLQGNRLSADYVIEMVITSALIPLLSTFWRLVGAVKYQTFFL